MTNEIKGALFDLDGVIADTAVYHFAAWRQLVKEHFQADLPDSLEEKTKGVSREDSLRVILDYLGVTVSEKEFTQLAAEKKRAIRKSTERFDRKGYPTWRSRLYRSTQGTQDPASPCFC